MKVEKAVSELAHLFRIDLRLHGKGTVLFAWHPEGTHVASTGTSRVIQIFTRNGEKMEPIVPPAPSICTALEWSEDGTVLAIMQASSPIVVLWHLHTNKTFQLDTHRKELTFMKWSTVGTQLAIGTGRGTLILYDKSTNVQSIAQAKHKKKVLCGSWSLDNKIAYASEDRQIIICSATGKILDQVKVKGHPIDIKFGGKPMNSHILAVNLSGKTILLYNLNGDNALELAFQPRYGTIVS